jgi:hypothetical protein
MQPCNALPDFSLSAAMRWFAPGFVLATAFCTFTSTPGRAENAMTINQDQMKWAPAAIPGVEAAALSGDPSKPGPFVMEFRWAAGSKAPPHWHSNTERVTMISGTGAVGMGDVLDPQKGTSVTPGAYMEMPAKMHHWFVAQTPVVMLLEGEGPFDLNLVDAATR